MIYSYDEVFKATLEYFDGDYLATDAWISKYALKNEKKQLVEKTPDDMHHRLAKEHARIEQNYPNPLSEEEIYQIFKNFKYIVPGGSPMEGTGNDYKYSSLSNCFVIESPKDSYPGILRTEREQIAIMKARGGVGFSLGTLRPKGMSTSSVSNKSSGVVLFGERYSRGTREVAQDGRRGALMLSLPVSHPDVEYFIDSKMEIGKITDANISIMITDDFMNAVQNNEDYEVKFEGYTGSFSKKISAKKIWDKIIHNAWKCIPYDTELPIYRDGVFEKIKIGDLVKQGGDNIEAISLNKDLRLERKRITGYQELSNDKDFYELKTRSSNTIRATGDHEIYVLQNEQVVKKPISLIQNGEYVLISKYIPAGNVTSIPIDISCFLGSSVYFDNFNTYLNQKDINNILGYYGLNKKSSYYIDRQKMPVSEFLKIKHLVDIRNLKLNPNTTNNNNFWIDGENIDIDVDFIKFIGIWYAEGSMSKESIHLNINRNELDDYTNILNSICLRYNTRFSTEGYGEYLRINICSRVLVNIFSALGIGYVDKKKQLPNWIFTISSSLIGDFLNGFYSGGGSIECNGSVTLSQANYNLIRDIQQLLLMIGIRSNLKLSYKEGFGEILGRSVHFNDTYHLYIYKQFNKTFYEKVGFTIYRKHELLEQFLSYTKDHFGTPLSKDHSDELGIWGSEFSSYRVIKNNDKNKIISSNLYDGDVYFDKVVNNDICESENIVYDITVEDNHNFILMNGMVISNCAEPGILYWNNILNESIPSCYGEGWKETSTNPCFTGDTMIAVADGRNSVSIKDLADENKDVPVYCMNNEGNLSIQTMRNPRLTGINQKIYKVILDSGDSFRCTGNHKFYLKDGNIKKTIDLKNGDSLQIMSRVKDIKFNNKQFLLHSNGQCLVEHRFIYNSLIKETENDIHHLDENPFNNSIDNLVSLSKSKHNEIHNKNYPGELNGNYSGITNLELLDKFNSITRMLGRRVGNREYFEYGGVNWSSYRKELAESPSEFLKQIADKMFDDKNLVFGDPRLIKKYKSAIDNGYTVTIKDGDIYVEKVCEYCNENFLTRYDTREISFCSQKCAIDNLNKVRWGGAKDILNRDCEFYNHKIVDIIEDGFEDVYNGTVDKYHNFYSGGFKGTTRGGQEKITYCVSAQCGEIPLCPYDSCRLYAINLYSYVTNPFTTEAKFDFELFKKHSRIAQRLMDDMIDLEIEKIDRIIEKIKNDPDKEDDQTTEINLWTKIREKAVQGRRTGLGVTAEGDMLAALGLRYGSNEAIEFSVRVHKTLAIESYKSSIEMAEERGCFPIWSGEKEMNNPFLGRILEELRGTEYEVFYSEKGRRNIANLTIAPTGTTSLMTQTTSGIEPLFLPYYKRRRKVNPEDKMERVDFVDETGQSWQEYLVFHPKFIDYCLIKDKGVIQTRQDVIKTLSNLSQESLNIIYKQSPYYLSTSADVDYLKKVEMQGKIQKWIDHSISVTVNMPEHVTEEIVGQVYMKAWEEGCKGVTVYREGSRSGVLVSIDNKEENNNEIIYRDAPKRPKILNCDIYHKTVLGKQWTIVVGLLKDKPYEIFAFEQLENPEFPHEIQKGTVDRVGKKHYRLSGIRGEKEYVVDNIILYLAKDEQFQTVNYSRSLRHGEHPKYIVKDIDNFSYVGSFHKTIGRVLKNYIYEDIKEKCPECGDDLVMQDGCVKCKSCTYSLCG